MEKNQKKKYLDCLIVGAGPAGLSASIYLKRAGINFVVLEKNVPCSKILKITKLENFAGCTLSPSDLALNMFKQVRKLDIEIKTENVLTVNKLKNYFEVISNKGNYLTKSLILSSGIKEQLHPIGDIDKYIGKGVSTCVTCDGYFFKNKIVSFCNFNDKYIDEIIYLSKICKKVLVFGEKFDASMRKKYKNIDFRSNETPISVSGNENIEILKTDKGIYIIKALFLPNIISNKKEYFSDLNLKKDKFGIIYKNDMSTSFKGVYVCGDICNRKLKQISVAIGDGAIAANSVIQYLK